jgi:hypothetical protein
MRPVSSPATANDGPAIIPMVRGNGASISSSILPSPFGATATFPLKDWPAS